MTQCLLEWSHFQELVFLYFGVSSFPWNFGLPNVNGIYLYLIICLICLFMVIQKSVMKYITRIGQNTGILKSSKKVQPKAITVALVAEYQNLNSGKRLMKGLNSSFCFVGSSNPSSSSASS